MIINKELDINSYITKSILHIRGIGYFLRNPSAFQESLMMALASSRLRIEGFKLFGDVPP